MAKSIEKLCSAKLLGVVIACSLIAACQQNKEVAGPPVMNGNWASTDGVYTANFLNGSFSATANDTGGVISQGEYVASASDRVKIKWTGLVSGTKNEADCVKPEANRLDCTDINGNRFSLVRSSVG
jgi:hypothetical protein